MTVKIEDLIVKFKAQRFFILSLNNSKLDEHQRHTLREISRLNHEITDMLQLQVPTMKELTRQAQEVLILEQLYQMGDVHDKKSSEEAERNA